MSDLQLMSKFGIFSHTPADNLRKAFKLSQDSKQQLSARSVLAIQYSCGLD